MKRLAFLAPLLLLAACITGPDGGYRPIPSLWMAPDSYLHAYPGPTRVLYMPYKRGNAVYSQATRFGDLCILRLPHATDPEMTEATVRGLWMIETANCNGALDVNNPLVGTRMGWADQWRYSRQYFTPLGDSSRWDATYKAMGGPY